MRELIGKIWWSNGELHEIIVELPDEATFQDVAKCNAELETDTLFVDQSKMVHNGEKWLVDLWDHPHHVAFLEAGGL